MPFSQSMAEKLRRIWKKEILRDNQEILPSEWSTLNQLAHISDEVFSDLISEGRIHPKLTRSEAADFRRSERDEEPKEFMVSKASANWDAPKLVRYRDLLTERLIHVEELINNFKFHAKI